MKALIGKKFRFRRTTRPTHTVTRVSVNDDGTVREVFDVKIQAQEVIVPVEEIMPILITVDDDKVDN